MKIENDEMQLLTEDIRFNINQTLEITKFAITASTALIGLSFTIFGMNTIFSPLICLLPIPILMAALEMIFNRRSNVMKKATFLRACPNVNNQWEKCLYYFRKNKNDKSSFTKTLFLMLFIMAILCSFASIIIELYLLKSIVNFQKHLLGIGFSHCFVVTLIAVSILLTIIYFIVKWIKIDNVLMGGKAEEKMFQTWVKIDKEYLRAELP